MAAELGWVGLGVSPDFTGFKAKTERETGKVMAAAGVSGGSKFGDAAGDSAGRRFASKMRSAAKVAAVGLAGAGIAAFKFGGDAVAEAREAAKVGKLTAAAIKSTGGAAKVSEKHVGKMSERLSNMAGIDDEVIQSGANVLLTFTKIRNETGKNNKIFDEATLAALNMSGALKTDLSSASIQVGKALNDPVKGVTALGRAGVQFSEDQKAAIKKMVESGDTLGAQKTILRELETQFKGAAKSQADEADKLSVAWGNFKEEVGNELLPVLDDLAVFLRKKGIPAAKEFFGWVKDEGIPALKNFKDQVTPVADKVKDLVGYLNDLPKSVKIGGLAGILALVGGAKLRGGGGALGTAGKVLGIAKPVPVFVTNPGLLGGGAGVDKPTSATKTALKGVAKYGGPAALLGGAALGLKELYDFNRGGDSGLAFLGGGRINDMIGETRKGLQGVKTDMDRIDTTGKRMGPYRVGIESNVQTVLNFARQYEGVLEGIPREVRTTFIQTTVRRQEGQLGAPNRGGGVDSGESFGRVGGVDVNIYGDVRPNDSREFFQDLDRRRRGAALSGRRP